MKLLHKDHKGGLRNLVSEILEPLAGEMSMKVERGSENILNYIDVYNEGVERSKAVKICKSIFGEMIAKLTGDSECREGVEKWKS